MDIVESPVVLMTGAGASASLGLHTMAGFMKLLYDRLRAQEDLWTFLNNICSYERHQPVSPAGRHVEPDLERVLLTLEDYKRLLARVEQGFLLAYANAVVDENIASLLSASGPAPFLELHRLTFGLEEFIKDLISQLYSRVDSEKAYQLYNPLFDLIQRCTGVSHLPLFTTNYDVATEEYVQSPKANARLVDGFARHRVGRRSWTGKFELEGFAGLQILLFKLHGSVCWIEPEPNEICSIDGLPAARLKTLGREMLIYPGLLKETIVDEPFRTLHRHLREYLRRARVLIVLGYSFRDPSIDHAIEVAAESNPDLALIVFNRNFDPAMADRLERFGLRVVHVKHYIDFKGSYLQDLERELEVSLAGPLKERYVAAAQRTFAALISPYSRTTFLRQLVIEFQMDVDNASRALTYLIMNNFVTATVAEDGEVLIEPSASLRPI